jgi:hypothetical protein
MCGRVIQSSGPLRLAIVDGLSVRSRNVPPRYNAAKEVVTSTRMKNGFMCSPGRLFAMCGSPLGGVRHDMHKARVLVATAFLLALTAHGANAASLNPAVVALTESGAGSSLAKRTHGCHYSCECDPLRDFGCEQVYHRHLHMLCLPVRCRGKDCDPQPSAGVCHHIVPP